MVPGVHLTNVGTGKGIEGRPRFGKGEIVEGSKKREEEPNLMVGLKL